MEHIHSHIGALIGKTPLVRINRLNTGGAEVVAAILLAAWSTRTDSGGTRTETRVPGPDVTPAPPP